MNDALVARLRALHVVSSGSTGQPDHYKLAADRIEALQKELIEANKIIKGWQVRMSNTSALEVELAERRKDAARYQWLRHGDNDEKVIVYMEHGEAFLLRVQNLDDAIDAAMEERKK